jgi:hypothetical protein
MNAIQPRYVASAVAILYIFTSLAVSSLDDAMDIVNKVGEAYVNLKSYDFEGQSQAPFEVNGVRYRMTVGHGHASAKPLTWIRQINGETTPGSDLTMARRPARKSAAWGCRDLTFSVSRAFPKP